MHEEYDDYEDDDYPNQDYPESKYKYYFKFDPQAWDAWGKWLYDSLNNAVGSDPNVWYVSGFPTHKQYKINKNLQYLGKNSDGNEIWKSKYFICDPIAIEYVEHIKSNAVYFLQQPHFYRGMFDILN